MGGVNCATDGFLRHFGRLIVFRGNGGYCFGSLLVVLLFA